MFAWRALPPAPGSAPGAYLTVPSLKAAGISVAFTTKGGGSSEAGFDLSLLSGAPHGEVAANRRRALSALGDGASWCSGRQVHGSRVEHAGRSDAGRGEDDPETSFPGTDALWTDEPGIALAVLTADCVPILIADPARRRVGVVHAGWRGAVAGVIEATVAAMGPSKDMRAYIGPSIGPCCYEVGDDVIGPATERFGSEVATDAGHLDLWRISRLALTRAGCASVHPSLMCTRCAPHRCFSHRAGATGRQASIASLS